MNQFDLYPGPERTRDPSSTSHRGASLMSLTRVKDLSPLFREVFGPPKVQRDPVASLLGPNPESSTPSTPCECSRDEKNTPSVGTGRRPSVETRSGSQDVPSSKNCNKYGTRTTPEESTQRSPFLKTPKENHDFPQGVSGKKFLFVIKFFHCWIRNSVFDAETKGRTAPKGGSRLSRQANHQSYVTHRSPVCPRKFPHLFIVKWARISEDSDGVSYHQTLSLHFTS